MININAIIIWAKVLQKRLVHRSGDGDFDADAVDKMWPFCL
jgi:hypothetical protein